MKVLITGANGFLGSHLTKALVESGYDVRCLLRKNSDISAIAGLKYETALGDVTAPQSLKNATKDCELIFHLAGIVSYKSSDRQLMEAVNVRGTQNLIEALDRKSLKKFIHLSSVVAIGAGLKAQQILNEDSEYNLSNYNLGYFETKRKAEVAVINSYIQDGVPCVILNPSTIYGYGDALKGSRKNQIKVARGELKICPPGGVSVISIEDAIFGITAAITKGRLGERYILSGDNLLIKDLFALIAEAAGSTPPTTVIPTYAMRALAKFSHLQESLGYSPKIPAETAYAASFFNWFEHQKAKSELGFFPRPAKEAITKSVEWMKKQGLLNK